MPGHRKSAGPVVDAQRRNDLLAGGVRDARGMLAEARLTARTRFTDPKAKDRAADAAERRLRARWPGFAALADHGSGQ